MRKRIEVLYPKKRRFFLVQRTLFSDMLIRYETSAVEGPSFLRLCRPAYIKPTSTRTNGNGGRYKCLQGATTFVKMWRSSLPQRIQRPFRRSKSSLGQTVSSSSTNDQPIPTVNRQPVRRYPMTPQCAHTNIPDTIRLPPYAVSAMPSPLGNMTQPLIHSDPGPLRRAGRLARTVLEVACRQCQVGVTTAEINAVVHETILAAGAYPSPLNYMGFPKSVCASVNEVICHGIPDDRPLAFGDVVSLDVSCYTAEGVHGDNCATVIVGDSDSGASGDADVSSDSKDWQGVSHRAEFATPQCEDHFREARRLMQATQECLQAGIEEVRPGGCLSSIGAACHAVADAYGYSSVGAYRGHGIGSEFHIPPFVSHVRNSEKMELRKNMIFTIEPMICVGSGDCFEWESDGWTVATVDGGLAVQFEHMVRVTDSGYEILTTTEGA